MNDSFLKQVTTRSAASEASTDGIDDFVAYGILRGVRDRAIMLELRLKDGSVTAIGYGWLERVDYCPSAGITLRFARNTVKLVGRNLNQEVRPNIRLVDGLLRHKVSFVQESSGTAAMTAGENATVVEAIRIE
jgi:hypothetical protein